MNDSSRSDSGNTLSRLGADQIATLLDIVRNSKLRQLSFVESLYRERALNFAETLQFLQDIGWLQVNHDQLELTNKADLFRLVRPRDYLGEGSIIKALTDTPGPYQNHLAAFLGHFHPSGSQIICRPSAQSRLEHGAIRNLLMQFGMVSHHAADDTYILHEHSTYLYFWAKHRRGAKTKEQLNKVAQQKDALGSAAEEVALDFEKERLGPAFAPFVDHVSKKHPGSCFDIQSLTLNGSTQLPRFIEVKAVPADSYQFFWSAAELEAASILQNSYFLYLLPALGANRFDLAGMQIISDPYTTVYQNPEAWTKQENVIVCRRRSGSN
jgi:hypothetical protein